MDRLCGLWHVRGEGSIQLRVKAGILAGGDGGGDGVLLPVLRGEDGGSQMRGGAEVCEVAVR
jgi:hypothetical protein